MKKKKWKLTQRVASNIIVVFAGVAFYLALSNFDAVRAQLAAWVRIIAPFIWGLALAYLLDGPVRFFEKKFHCRRGLSIALCCFAQRMRKSRKKNENFTSLSYNKKKNMKKRLQRLTACKMKGPCCKKAAGVVLCKQSFSRDKKAV